MKYVALTICLASVIALVFFLRGDTAPQSSDEQVAQVGQSKLDEGFEPVTPLESVKPEELNSQLEGKYPCPQYTMPDDNFPLEGEDSKMVVRPNDKIDYKMIIINPCLPSSAESNEKKKLPK